MTPRAWPTANAVWTFFEKNSRSTPTIDRCVELDQVADEQVQGEQPLGQRQIGRSREDAVVDGPQVRAGPLEDPVAHGGRARVDAEDDHARPLRAPGRARRWITSAMRSESRRGVGTYCRSGRARGPSRSDLGEDFVGDLEVRGHALDVVEVLEQFDQPQGLARLASLELDRCFAIIVDSADSILYAAGFERTRTCSRSDGPV